MRDPNGLPREKISNPGNQQDRGENILVSPEMYLLMRFWIKRDISQPIDDRGVVWFLR